MDKSELTIVAAASVATIRTFGTITICNALRYSDGTVDQKVSEMTLAEAIDFVNEKSDDLLSLIMEDSIIRALKNPPCH